MTLDEAFAELRRRFTLVDGLPCALAQTGEEYVIITAAGIDPEPISSVLCLNEGMAVKLWFDTVLKYAEGKSGTLYWRMPVEVDRDVIYREWTPAALGAATDIPMVGISTEAPCLVPIDCWRVYSRLLISDRPALYPTIEALDARQPSSQEVA